MSDEEIRKNAKEFVKKNKEAIIRSFTENSTAPESKPVSIFMAGSPGAGKTEVSKSLASIFYCTPVLIDADEIRKLCPGYTGTNAHLFQEAAVKGVNLLLDYALDHKLNFILDGTFAYGNSLQNIQRSVDKGCIVEVWFIYQKPGLAWRFTQARESVESRRVIKETFIKATIQSRENVIRVKKYFGKSIELNLLIKNLDNTDEKIRLNISEDELDRFLRAEYTDSELENILLQ